jgi:heme exporter protein D
MTLDTAVRLAVGLSLLIGVVVVLIVRADSMLRRAERQRRREEYERDRSPGVSEW